MFSARLVAAAGSGPAFAGAPRAQEEEEEEAKVNFCEREKRAAVICFCQNSPNENLTFNFPLMLQKCSDNL